MIISVGGLVTTLLNGVHIREFAAVLHNTDRRQIALLERVIAAMGNVVTLDEDRICLVSAASGTRPICKIPDRMTDKASRLFGNVRAPSPKKVYHALLKQDRHLVRMPYWWPAAKDFPVILYTGTLTTAEIDDRSWASRRFAEYVFPVIAFSENGESRLEFLRVPYAVYSKIIASGKTDFTINKHESKLEFVENGNEINQELVDEGRTRLQEMFELFESDLPGLGLNYARVLGGFFAAGVRFNPAYQRTLINTKATKQG